MRVLEKSIQDVPPLNGLLLAGGRSRRMGADKASLRFNGETQAERTFALLESVCTHAFVSLRAEQARQVPFASMPCIIDEQVGLGPVGGILSAMKREPGVAWLVLACDLPLLDPRTLAELVSLRDATRIATAYRAAENGLPEPLCAIYEPASRAVIEAAVGEGIRCPRKILMRAETALVDLPEPDALANINTPNDLEAVQAILKERESASA